MACNSTSIYKIMCDSTNSTETESTAHLPSPLATDHLFWRRGEFPIMSVIETPTGDLVHRQRGDGAATDHHHHLSKWKDDDYDAVSVRKKKDSKTTTPLQFFVRMMSQSKSLIIHGCEEETVKSVHEKIERITGIPVREQRLIYKGKQLGPDKSLGECGVQNDANIQLVGYLRSGGCSKLWQAMENMVSLICSMCKGEMVNEASKTINHLMTMYFDIPDYFDVFMSSKAPFMLVKLYLSPFKGNKDIGCSAIRHFFSCCNTSLCKELKRCSFVVLLKFCRLLKLMGCDDSLYSYCWNSYWTLVKETGYSGGYRNMVHDMFLFISDIVENLLRDLNLSINSPNGVGPLWRDVNDFTAFLMTLRFGIRRRQASEGSVNNGICHREGFLLAHQYEHLRIIYIRLLSKLDECLHGMEGCLANKEQGEGKETVVYSGWSQYLKILKELYQISKLYDGAEEKFWMFLMHRRSMFSLLIVRYAKRTDDHQWILEHKSVTNFEARRHLAMLLFPDEEEDYDDGLYEMLIDRSNLLTESFEYIARAEPGSLQAGLFMQFQNEEATGPGVLREWFLLVCQAIFNLQNTLFVACPNDRRRLFPSPELHFLAAWGHATHQK